MGDIIKNFVTHKAFINFIITLTTSLITTLSICITGYTHYIEKNIINDKSIESAQAEIRAINTQIEVLKDEHNKFLLMDEKLSNANHTIDLKLSSLKNNVQNISDYQQILRTEVKEIAENKLNTVDFWRLDDKIFIRLRWLEENIRSKEFQRCRDN